MIGGGIVLAGFIMTLKKPAPQPGAAISCTTRCCESRSPRRNTEIAQENTRRRQPGRAERRTAAARGRLAMRALGPAVGGGAGCLRRSTFSIGHTGSLAANYREVSSDSDYRGTGIGGKGNVGVEEALGRRRALEG